MKTKIKIKKGDHVVILAGKNRGAKGKVLKVLPWEGRVVVEGVNLLKKRERSRQQGQKGQMIAMASPVNVSNVALFCGSCGRGVRLGSKLVGDKKTRICKRCGAAI